MQLQQEQDYEEFGKKDVSTLTGEQVKAALLEAGLFSFIIQRPYIVVADPNAKPKGIFVSAFDTNPLAADFEFVLKGQEKDFQTGLDALAKDGEDVSEYQRRAEESCTDQAPRM